MPFVVVVPQRITPPVKGILPYPKLRSSNIREQFHKIIEHEVLFDIPFRLEQQVLDKQAGIRTIVLDTGFRVSGPILDFDDPSIYSQHETENGEVEIRIRGRAIGDRVRTTSRR